MANEIAKAEKLSLGQWLNTDRIMENITNVIPRNEVKIFIANIVSAVNANSDLKECTRESILSGALLGHSLNLPPSPNLNFMYLVPFNNTKQGTKEAVFVLSYKGYIQLAIRSGQYKRIVASEVKEGELKSYNPITEEFVIEPIADIKARLKAPVVGYYAMIELVNGFRKEIYWTKEQMKQHAITYSKGYNAKKGCTFWEKNFDEMAKKTLIRQIVSKWGIMSVEMQKAYEGDMGIENEDGTFRYPDNEANVREDMANEIAENANSEVIEVDYEEVDAEQIMADLLGGK